MLDSGCELARPINTIRNVFVLKALWYLDMLPLVVGIGVAVVVVILLPIVAPAAVAEPAPVLSAEPAMRVTKRMETAPVEMVSQTDTTLTDHFGIVVFSHLRWGFVWQRPQQFLSRFARKHPILFVEEPMFDAAEGMEPRVQMHAVMPNVTVACVHVPQSMSRSRQMPSLLRRLTQEAIGRINENSGAFDQPLLWYYSPMDSAWSLGYIENRGVVYDCMDELSQFTGAPKRLTAHETRLMEHADIVFTGGYKLGDKKRKQHSNVHVFGCGVEFDHFNKAQDPTTVIPPEIASMSRPILGWIGVVDERVDYDLLGKMARLRPDWSFVMVGPVVKVDQNLLPRAPNLFWMGGRDHKQAPNYCAAFDICMMCFALNPSTEFINPTKALEYMATGRPIISTRVRDVVQQWSDVVYLANDAEEFVSQAEKALGDARGQRVQRGLELAQQNSWDARVNKMRGLIRDAISHSGKKRDITPLTGAELEYVYQPTQGS